MSMREDHTATAKWLLSGCTGKIPLVFEERGECYPQVRKVLYNIEELACTDPNKGVVQEEKAAAIPRIGKSCTG